jgi:hypothetical protein
MATRKVTLIRNAVKLHKEIQITEDRLKKLKAQMTMTFPRILDFFATEGIKRMSCDGFTVASRCETWASVKEGKIEALREAMLAVGDDPDAIIALKCASNTLSAYIREFIRNQEDIPPEVSECCKITEKWLVSFTRSEVSRLPTNRKKDAGNGDSKEISLDQ